jgi:hypothetical protein
MKPWALLGQPWSDFSLPQKEEERAKERRRVVEAHAVVCEWRHSDV